MTLFKKELRNLAVRFIIMLTILVVTGYFVLANYELFKGSIDLTQIHTGLKMTPWLNRLLDADMLSQQIQVIMNNQDLYVWSQWFSKNFLQILLLSIVLLGFSSFSREREQDTLPFLLSHYTRLEIFRAKLGAGLLVLLLLIVSGSILPAIMAPFYGFVFSWTLSLWYGLQIAIASAFLYSIVILLSIQSRDVIKPIIGSILIFIGLSIPGKLGIPEFLNIYRYMAGTNIFVNHQLSIILSIVLLLMSIMLFIIDWTYFRRKDL